MFRARNLLRDLTVPGNRVCRAIIGLTPLVAILCAGFVSLGWKPGSWAACTTITNGCSYGGTLPPCSNLTYCYSAPQGYTCTNGGVVVAYKNATSAMDWASCATYKDLGQCVETLAACGTQTVFTNPRCTNNSSCTLQNGPIQWCKGPAPQDGCITPP
jgi:hypothetical protein